MILKCIKRSETTEEGVPVVGKIYKNVKIQITSRKFVTNTDSDTWYQLEETGDLLHHSSLFKILEIESDIEDKLLLKYKRKFDSIKVLNKILEK